MFADERLIDIMDGKPRLCTERTEVYSRVCGFYRPVSQWARGKQQEFRDRKDYTP